MSTNEHTHLKNVTPAPGSTTNTTTTDETAVSGKGSIYQHPFFIVASSLLAVFVLIAVAGQSSAPEMTAGAAALTNYDAANSAVTIDFSGMSDIFGKCNDGSTGKCPPICKGCYCVRNNRSSCCNSCCDGCCIDDHDDICHVLHCTHRGDDVYNNKQKTKLNCCEGLHETQKTCRGNEICTFCL